MPHIAVPEGKADPEVRVWALRPEMGMGAGALSHAIYEESILPVRERELARMRIAQINDCAICQQWRKTEGTAGALTAIGNAAAIGCVGVALTTACFAAAPAGGSAEVVTAVGAGTLA